jgi:hypothetical protein
MSPLTFPAICDSCRNLRETDDTLRCAAFPAGIPDDITLHGFDHRNPHSGDNGVQHELEDGREKWLVLYEQSVIFLERDPDDPSQIPD